MDASAAQQYQGSHPDDLTSPTFFPVAREEQIEDELRKKNVRQPYKPLSFKEEERHEAVYVLPGDLRPTADTFSHLFLPDEFIDEVAEHSTNYAKMRLGVLAYPISSFEILHFFAFLFIMGIVRLPCKEDYWRTNGRYNIHMCNEHGMNLTKFKYLWRNIHFEPPTQVEADADEDSEGEDDGEIRLATGRNRAEDDGRNAPEHMPAAEEVFADEPVAGDAEAAEDEER